MYKLLSKTFLFFDYSDKKNLIALFALYLFVGMIEIFGIASIVPFVGLLTDPEYFSNNKYYMLFKDYFSLLDEQMVIVSGLTFISIFCSR